MDFVVHLCVRFGFRPYGTVGKYSAAPVPVWKAMIAGVKKCDCVVLAATPRYVQQDVHSARAAGRGLPEMLHVEMGMAAIEGKPVVAFVQKGTAVGSFLPQYVQYIEIDVHDKSDLREKLPLIASYFRNAADLIARNSAERSKSDLLKLGGGVLMGIGAIKVIDILLSKDEGE